MADSLRERGDEEGARATYSLLELDLEKYFGERNPFTVRVRAKKDGSPEAEYIAMNG